MTPAEITKKIVDVLRATALSGSSREVRMDAPLGEAGLGLDSLALVRFITALENEVNILIPVETWSQADRVTLQHFADLCLSLPPIAGPDQK